MKQRPAVLCVDDEPLTLEGLTLHLRKRFRVVTATGGAAALALIRDHPDLAIILSDMRMPEMNGAVFLERAREAAPDAVRMLLTGQTDLESAIAAVNEGQIFRFLTKPCSPDRLLNAFDAALEQRNLIMAERELLEQTLRGCIDTLTDVLSLTNPVAFGRATRVKQLVVELAEELKAPRAWQVEVAAMLSEIGCITLPEKTVERLYRGEELSDAEERMVDRLPEVVHRLLGRIPRLEPILEILDGQWRPINLNVGAHVPLGARMLRVAGDFDRLEARGRSAHEAISTMRAESGRYDARVLDAFCDLRSRGSAAGTELETPVHELRAGMVLAENVFMRSGCLFVARGYEVTENLVERIRNMQPGTLAGRVKVFIRARSRAGRAG